MRELPTGNDTSRGFQRPDTSTHPAEPTTGRSQLTSGACWAFARSQLALARMPSAWTRQGCTAPCLLIHETAQSKVSGSTHERDKRAPARTPSLPPQRCGRPLPSSSWSRRRAATTTPPSATLVTLAELSHTRQRRTFLPSVRASSFPTILLSWSRLISFCPSILTCRTAMRAFSHSACASRTSCCRLSQSGRGTGTRIDVAPAG